MKGWLLPLLLLCISLVPASLWPAWLQNAWQRQVWPALNGWCQAVQAASPLPLAPLLLAVLLLLLAGAVLRRGPPATRLRRATLLVAVLVCWLQLTWGGNYARPAVAGQLGLSGRASPDQRQELVDYLLQVLQETAGAEPDVEAATIAARGELQRLLPSLSLGQVLRAEPVRVPAGLFLSFGVSGSLFPFTLEALVDSGLTDWQQVAVGVHELAHVAGVAREDDATLLASLAGLRSGHDYARYALALDALLQLELLPDERATALSRLPARALADVEAAAEAARAYRSSLLSAAQNRLFSIWLRLQGSEQGLADYSVGASRLPLALEAGLLP